MTKTLPTPPVRRGNPLRPYVWGGAALLLSLPLIAMQFTEEVDWTLSDFVIMGILLGGACAAYELGTRLSGHWAYRAGFAVAILGGFLMTWINLAVGIVGSEDNPVNQLFFAILMVGAIAAPLGRFTARGMARAMYATAIAQALVTVYLALAGHGYTFVLAGFFIAVWLCAAHLFLRSGSDAPAPERG